MDKGGQVFNAQAYGWLPDGTDRSAQALALLTAVSNAGGGTIYFPPSTGKYRADSQLVIPNNGTVPSDQKNIRLMGAGGGKTWDWNSDLGASVLDLRYSGTGGKITSLGHGALEIDNLTFIDGSTNNATPFIYDTDTTLTVKDNTFVGSGSVTQDAIILGGTTTAQDGTINAAFAGYGTIVDSNQFTNLNRGVYIRTYGNSIIVSNNSWYSNVGTRAIEVDGTVGGGINGLVISGNLIEMDQYTYGIVLKQVEGATLIGNNFHDDGVNVVDEYYMTLSTNNTIITGENNTKFNNNNNKIVGGDATSLASNLIMGGKGTTMFSGNVGIGTATASQMLTVGNSNQFTVSSTGALTTQSMAIGSATVAPVVVSCSGCGPQDPSGTYQYVSQYNGANEYQRGTDSFYFWYSPGWAWLISPVVGDGDNAWYDDNTNGSPPNPPLVTDTWIGMNGGTGTPHASVGSISKLVLDSYGDITTTGVLNLTGAGNSYILGKVGIGTSTPGHLLTLSGGAYSDGSTWQTVSDAAMKQNFATVTPSYVLQKILTLPISQWNYKTDSATTTHIGPTAQDFYAAFHLGGDGGQTSIDSLDPANIALLGIQALDQQITALQGSLTGNATATNLTVYNPGNFSGDSVGEAKILSGQTSVRITFTQPYAYQPIVTATPVGDSAQIGRAHV